MPKFRLNRLPTGFPLEEAKDHPDFQSQKVQRARSTWLSSKLEPHVHKNDLEDLKGWVTADLTRARTAVMAILVMEQKQNEKPGKEKHEADADAS